MILYLGIFLFLAILSYLDIFNKIEDKTKYILCIGISIFFIVLSTIRYGGPGDWDSYVLYWNTVNPAKFVNPPEFQFEFLYFLLNWICKNILNNYYFFIFIEACIVWYFWTALIKDTCISDNHNNENTNISPFLMYLILWSIQFGNIFIIRSTIAFSILMYSIIFIKKRKLIPYIICIVFACMFHRSAIIWVLTYPLYWMCLSKKFIIISALSVIILVCLDVNEILINIVECLYPFLSDGVYGRLIKYLSESTNEMYGLNYSYIFVLFKSSINMIFSNIVFLYFRKSFKNDKEYDGLFNIFYIGSLLNVFLLSMNQSLSKISTPLLLVQVILFSKIFQKDYKYKKIVYIVLSLYFVFRLIMALGNYDLYIPFRSIFN